MREIEQTLQQIIRFATARDEYGTSVVKIEDRELYKTACTHFGNWTQALSAAGLRKRSHTVMNGMIGEEFTRRLLETLQGRKVRDVLTSDVELFAAAPGARQAFDALEDTLLSFEEITSKRDGQHLVIKGVKSVENDLLEPTPSQQLDFGFDIEKSAITKQGYPDFALHLQDHSCWCEVKSVINLWMTDWIRQHYFNGQIAHDSIESILFQSIIKRYAHYHSELGFGNEQVNWAKGEKVQVPRDHLAGLMFVYEKSAISFLSASQGDGHLALYRVVGYEEARQLFYEIGLQEEFESFVSCPQEFRQTHRSFFAKKKSSRQGELPL